MDVRELDATDEAALRDFFAALPAGDHAFVKEDPATFLRRLSGDRGVRLAAFGERGEIEAIAAVWPGIGHASHVGDLRLVVAESARRQGVGQRLSREALIAALRLGMWKLSVEVVSTQQGTIDMFLALGFEAEALLRDQLSSDEGFQDVVLLSHFAEHAADGALLAAPDAA
jgi:L-amino acid N-acyltransferase YncA